MKSNKQFHLTVLGVHVKSDGFPNVTCRLQSIAATKCVHVNEIDFPFRPLKIVQGKLQKHKTFRFLSASCRVVYSHFKVMIAYLSKMPFVAVYVPYPAVYILYMLSLMPRQWRPKYVMADAFISLYDTIVNDRELVARNGIIASILRHIETRAYNSADRIIVDTELNANYFRITFGLSPDKVKALPLSINQEEYKYYPYQPNDIKCQVLFIGTFVPLQGVETIARAIKLLNGLKNIQFTLIGTGQSATAVRAILGTELRNFVWYETWHTSSQLATKIQQADICLGIFGAGEKTQRVWPLKNYAYMSVGKAIISGDTFCARELSKLSDELLFLSVPVNNHYALAEAIQHLARHKELRSKLSAQSHRFFQQHLNDKIAVEYILSQLPAD